MKTTQAERDGWRKLVGPDLLADSRTLARLLDDADLCARLAARVEELEREKRDALEMFAALVHQIGGEVSISLVGLMNARKLVLTRHPDIGFRGPTYSAVLANTSPSPDNP